MSFPRDAYPYTNFHELNLGYFITHFREIFSQWADLYDQMTDWKDATDEELATWKAGVEDDLDQREAALRAELETWKAQTGQDIAGWEDATLAALTAWQTATQAVFEAIRVEAAGSASAAAASAGDAATAKTAAETAQAATEAAAASIASSAAQIATNTEDISELKTQLNAVETETYPAISFNWVHGGIDNQTGQTNNDGSLTRSRDETYYKVSDLHSITNDSASLLFIIFYTESNGTYIFASSVQVDANSTYYFNGGEYVRFDIRGSLAQADLVSGLQAMQIIVSDVLLLKNDVTNIQGAFSTRCGTNNIDACNSTIYNNKAVRFALPAVVTGGSFLDKIVYKSNAIKTIDFYLGSYDSANGKVTIQEVITCSVIVGVNTLTNGVDFTSETVVGDNYVIGYRCDTTQDSNGFYSDIETSLVSASAYVNVPVSGDVITLDPVKPYGIGIYATFKTFSIPELADEISELDEKVEEYHKTQIPWEYAIDKVLCIGDSLTKGSPADSQTMPYPLKENYPYFLERMISVECTNTGVPGITTQNWYKNEYTKYTMTNYNTFIIFLGTNGGLTDTLATDVDPYNDYNDFADTQTGNYCKIIEHIMSDKNDDAIIILVNTWYNGSGQGTTRLVIDKIGEKYGLPVIETVNTMPYSVNPEYHGNVNNVHCSKAGYLALASLICDGVRKYIEENPDFANKSMTQGS